MKLLFVPLRFLITPVFIAAVDVVLLFPMVLSLIDVGQGIPRHVDTHEPVTIALVLIAIGTLIQIRHVFVLVATLWRRKHFEEHAAA